LLAKAALTLKAVAGPEMVNPLAAVKFLRILCPEYKLVPVNATVTLVTPTGELAVKVKAADGWNMFVPLG
jgi:hypothetical protein